MAIATAAKQVIVDGMDVVVGGGVESISLAQNEHMNGYRAEDPWLVEHRPDRHIKVARFKDYAARKEAPDGYGGRRAPNLSKRTSSWWTRARRGTSRRSADKARWRS